MRYLPLERRKEKKKKIETFPKKKSKVASLNKKKTFFTFRSTLSHHTHTKKFILTPGKFA